MKQLRTAGLLAAIAVTGMLVTTGTAAAQTPAFTKSVPVTGTAKNGKPFKGTYTIKRFIAQDGKAWAVGRLTGTVGKRKVTRNGVKMPAALQTVAQSSSQPLPTPGACPVLNLVLGPINLNLLGLRVATNQVRALVEAIPGAGNLLGNLLCAVTNLLNPVANTPLGQLVQVLNALLALVPSTPAAGGARVPAVAASS